MLQISYITEFNFLDVAKNSKHLWSQKFPVGLYLGE